MKESPYSKFLEMVKPDAPKVGSVVIGEVTSITPFTILIGDLPIDEEEILISDHLVEGYQRSYSSDRVIPNGSSVGNITYTDGLNIGDKLAIMPTADKQLYIVLVRVRRL